MGEKTRKCFSIAESPGPLYEAKCCSTRGWFSPGYNNVALKEKLESTKIKLVRSKLYKNCRLGIDSKHLTGASLVKSLETLDLLESDHKKDDIRHIICYMKQIKKRT